MQLLSKPVAVDPIAGACPLLLTPRSIAPPLQMRIAGHNMPGVALPRAGIAKCGFGSEHVHPAYEFVGTGTADVAIEVAT